MMVQQLALVPLSNGGIATGISIPWQWRHSDWHYYLPDNGRTETSTMQAHLREEVHEHITEPTQRAEHYVHV